MVSHPMETYYIYLIYQYEGNTQLWKDHFPYLISLFLRKMFFAWCDRKDWFELPIFWAMCQKGTTFLQKLWLLQRNISRSWGVSTAKMMSGSQHNRWVFQSWHRLQRCSEKLWRKQTCMCKCRLQRTCGVTSKTSPGVLYYLLFTLDLNGRSLPIFWINKKIRDSASQQKSHPQTRGSHCLGPPGRGTVPSNDRKCGKGGGFWRREISQ